MVEKGVMPKQTAVANANRCHCCIRPAVSVNEDEEDAQLI
jgi:hypothetical protein